MQKLTKIKKRKTKKINEELEALNKMRDNKDIQAAINLYLIQVPLSKAQQERLRTTLAVLSRAPLKKLLAFL